MRRALVAVALLLAGIVAVPPAAADHEHFLTVTGSRGGYADFRLPRGVVVDVPGSRYGPGVTGFYIVALHGTARLGTISANIERSWPAPYGSQSLPAGEYRVYLLADRPASIGIRMAYLPHDVTVRATRRTYVNLNAGPIEVHRELTRWAGRHETRLRGGPRSVLFALTYMSLPDRVVPVPYQWGDVYYCTGLAEGPGCDEQNVQTHGVAPSETSPGVTKHHWMREGTVPEGQAYFQHYAGSVQPDRSYAVAIEFFVA
jgi:hypothetical protein